MLKQPIKNFKPQHLLIKERAKLFVLTLFRNKDIEAIFSPKIILYLCPYLISHGRDNLKVVFLCEYIIVYSRKNQVSSSFVSKIMQEQY